MKVEIYPYKNYTHPVIRKYNKQNLITEDDLNYIHNRYLQLLNNCCIDDIIQIILQKLLKLLNSENVSLYIFETENLIYHRTINNIIQINTIDYQSCISKSKVLISNDTITDVRILIRDDILNTVCCIPLITTDNKYNGIIYINGNDKYTIKDIIHAKILLHFLTNILPLTKTQQSCTTKEPYHQGLDIIVNKEVGDFKDLFITTISHEIRTPLNGIVGMTRLLQDSEGLTEKQYNYIRILSECSTQLMELINDILDLTRMNSGNLPLNISLFDLQECIQSSIDIVYSKAIEKKLEIKIQHQCINSKLSTMLINNIDTPRQYNQYIPKTLLYGDPRRLKQVLINLLNNAIKFTDTGSILLTMNIHELENDKKDIQFSIKDTGVGIPSKYHEKIFEIFSKIHLGNPTSPGTGLGLSISKKLIELMGGHISVKSDGVPGRGSIFTFNIIVDSPGAVEKVNPINLIGKTILVVDDNEDNRVYLSEILSEWGVNTYCFSSARELLSYLKHCDTNLTTMHKSFDLAIIDICMPHMSGIDLMYTIKEKGFLQPLIGLSSVGDTINGKELFDSFCIKPVSKAKLFELITKVLENTNTTVKKQSSVSSRSSSSTTQPQLIKQSSQRQKKDLKIIIAEDDYYNKIVLQELLKSLGYSNITTVDNGDICVNTIKNIKFDVCFMDVKMPIMDGLEATRIIKQYPNCPVVIGVSASVLEIDKDKCFKSGMDGYIPKPIQKEKLETLLNTIKSKVV